MSFFFFFRVHQLGSRHQVGKQFDLTRLRLCLGSFLERVEGKGISNACEGMSITMMLRHRWDGVW